MRDMNAKVGEKPPPQKKVTKVGSSNKQQK